MQAARDLGDYISVRDFLYGLRYHGAKYGLERMEAFAKLMGAPHTRMPFIHVAGTNGKGSTCAMLEQIFRDQGYCTGFYSSPHLIRQGERIQVNREILSEDDIVRLTKTMVKVLLQDASMRLEKWPSFFEFMTVMAFLRFAEQKVDIAVMETGLGGRLDATNILIPDVSVITSISLDHTNILGDSIEKIAAEKAGIIKAGIPVVLGDLPIAAEQVIREKANLLSAPVYAIRERWGSAIDTYPVSNLTGEYQRINAAISLLVCEVLNQTFPTRYQVQLEQAKTSLTHVYWPGRWEKVQLQQGVADEECEIILDATHNEEGARMLELNLKRLIDEKGRKPVIAVGSLGEDRAKSLMEAVCRWSDTIYLLHPNQPRALTFEQLRSCVPADYHGTVVDARVEDLFGFHEIKLPLAPGQALVVTGSIYLIGEVSDVLKSTPVVNQQSLQDVV